MTRALRILVVDDSAPMRLIIGNYLSANLPGAAVHEAAGGAEALALVAAQRPDAVVLDLDMPGLDGLEVLRNLRADGGDVPVVVFSSARQACLDAALELGADAALAKPGVQFLVRELTAVLDRRAA
jgi:two-component system response regulator MprA